MHAVLRTFYQIKHSCFQWINNHLVMKCINSRLNISTRLYHSENGVYGYRSNPQKHFEGISIIIIFIIIILFVLK